jgi:hypothetical protein
MRSVPVANSRFLKTRRSTRGLSAVNDLQIKSVRPRTVVAAKNLMKVLSNQS